MTVADPVSHADPATVAAQVSHRPPTTAVGHLLRRRRTVTCLAVVALYVVAGVAMGAPAGLVSGLPFGIGRRLPLIGRADRAVEHVISDPVGGSYDPPRFGRHPAAWLGTDIQGRSVLWRVVYGTRVALLLTIGTSAVSIALGTVAGILSGFFGGWVDALITWLFTTISSIPWILLVVAIITAVQGYEFADGETFKDRFGDIPILILALGLTDWVGLCRLLRGEVLKVRAADYVMAARAAGAGTGRVLARHVLPNVAHLIIITFSLSAVGYVQAEVALTFIGIGVGEKPSWGRMITDSRVEILRGVWWQAAAASVAIFAVTWALNVLGDDLRDALDPRTRTSV